MAFRIDPGQPVDQTVRELVTAQIEAALRDTRNTELDPHYVVHEARKRCKKVRGVLRLVRTALGGTYAEENAFFRDAARNLSAARDATAQIECYERVCRTLADNEDPAGFAPVRAGLDVRRNEAAAHRDDVRAALEDFAAAMGAARERLKHWSFEKKDFDAIGPGLARTFKRGRKAMKKAYSMQDGAAFHEWRKRVKYHRYHLALLRHTWEPVAGAFFNELKYLSDLLGQEHDITVLTETLREQPQDFGGEEIALAFAGIAERQQAELRARAEPIGLRVYAEKPAGLRRRYAAYWDTHRRERHGELPS
jgi:CHAD domain-containing protein